MQFELRDRLRTQRIVFIRFLLSIAQELDPHKIVLVGGLKLQDWKRAVVFSLFHSDFHYDSWSAAVVTGYPLESAAIFG